MREIKFRCWNKDINMFDFVTIKDTNYYNQFTGLKDKNGVDIYEGDILEQINRDNSISQYIVEYRAPEFALRRISDLGILGSLCLSEQFNLFKVIGNKYENI